MTAKSRSNRVVEKTAEKPRRPDHLAHGRWLGDFPRLSAAEKKLIACCAQGKQCVLGTGELPEKPDASNRIRADLIRFLLLGGDSEHPVHETGVQIAGGWVKGRLNLDNATVPVWIRLLRCQIADGITGFDARLKSLNLSHSSSSGIDADRVIVDGSITLSGFTSSGEISLIAGNIGTLNCKDAKLSGGMKSDGTMSPALTADQLNVRNGIFLNGDFSAHGEVRFIGATINGNFSCSGKFSSAVDGKLSRPCMTADRINVIGSVFLSDGFSATGEVRFLGAKISGNMNCRGGIFVHADAEGNPSGHALSLDRSSIGGSLNLDGGFSATGEVRVIGSDIKGNFSCKDATFKSLHADQKKSHAIAGDGVKVGASIFFSDGFSATGSVRLHSARIGHNLECAGATFNNPTGNALNCQSAEVTGGLLFRKIKAHGRIDLTALHIGTLVDDPACWPEKSLFLDGFRYDRIAAGPTDADTRIKWLKCQIADHLMRDFKPQPWEQLIKVLREMGHPYEASKVAMEKQRQWRKSWQLPLWRPRRWLNAAYGGLAGYGYRPWWTVGWMALVCCICSWIYYEGRHDGLIGPTSPPIQLSKALEICGDGGTPGKISWTSPDCPLPPEYTSFQPFWYSLDLILPFVDLQQEHDWAPITGNERGQQLTAGHLLRFVMWFEILFGWITGVLLAAVAGNLVKKD